MDVRPHPNRWPPAGTAIKTSSTKRLLTNILLAFKIHSLDSDALKNGLVRVRLCISIINQQHGHELR